MTEIEQSAQAHRTALIVIDMQTVFIDPSGASAIAGAAPVLDAVNAHVAAAVERDQPVFYTRDVAPTDDLPPGDPENQAGLHPGLDVRGTVIDKGPGKRGGFSGFLLAADRPGTDDPGRGGLNDLAGQLRAAEITHVVVIGLAADVCVAATARDARRLGYQVTISLNATAFAHAHPQGDAAALADLRTAGITITD